MIGGMFKFAKIHRSAVSLIGCAVLSAVSQMAIAADGKEEASWRPLYRGTLDDFRIYFRGQGFIEDVNRQDVYVAEPDMIHVKQGTNGVIVTKVPYDHYHVKVDYRWGKKGGSINAGLLTHIDLDSKAVEDNRPKSIEINMKHDDPASVYLASKLGPFADSFVKEGTNRFLPEAQGGVFHTGNPFGQRVIVANYPDGKINTRPYGEWNTLEAIVRGAGSVEIILNGAKVLKLTNILDVKPGTNEPGEPLVSGGIGLQSEGQEIFYRNFVIRKLDQ